jgi:hypothetical protein
VRVQDREARIVAVAVERLLGVPFDQVDGSSSYVWHLFNRLDDLRTLLKLTS